MDQLDHMTSIGSYRGALQRLMREELQLGPRDHLHGDGVGDVPPVEGPAAGREQLHARGHGRIEGGIVGDLTTCAPICSIPLQGLYGGMPVEMPPIES